MASRVLYVDDEADIRELARLSLENLGGMQVAACSSGEEALAMMHDFNPDIVVLDVIMPGMTGPQILDILRADTRFCDIPVIFMTGSMDAADTKQLEMLDVAGVLHKPFDPLGLPGQIVEFWKKSRV